MPWIIRSATAPSICSTIGISVRIDARTMILRRGGATCTRERHAGGCGVLPSLLRSRGDDRLCGARRIILLFDGGCCRCRRGGSCCCSCCCCCGGDGSGIVDSILVHGNGGHVCSCGCFLCQRAHLHWRGCSCSSGCSCRVGTRDRMRGCSPRRIHLLSLDVLLFRAISMCRATATSLDVAAHLTVITPIRGCSSHLRLTKAADSFRTTLCSLVVRMPIIVGISSRGGHSRGGNVLRRMRGIRLG
mmetsp:Transcript_9788/g.26188  ORF Transcript_9788/g.26188 Transcript_9788/m.26188 type:complete len:245 (-) Transcript_9788:425-1159(-)